MPSNFQHTARYLTWLYLLTAAIGVIVPMSAQVGTLKWRIGHCLTSKVNIVGAHQLTNDQITMVGDHTLNLIMLFPLTLLAALGWPKIRPWIWGITATIIGICSEAAQFAFPQLGRRPLVSNAVENAMGGWLGAGVAACLYRLRHYVTRRSPHRR